MSKQLHSQLQMAIVTRQFPASETHPALDVRRFSMRYILEARLARFVVYPGQAPEMRDDFRPSEYTCGYLRSLFCEFGNAFFRDRLFRSAME